MKQTIPPTHSPTETVEVSHSFTDSYCYICAGVCKYRFDYKKGKNMTTKVEPTETVSEDMKATTYSSMPVKDLTMEDLAEAVKLLKPMPRQKLAMCKKHFKLLNQRLPKYESHANPMYPSILGELGGIPIEIRPYLKKVRLYEESYDQSNN